MNRTIQKTVLLLSLILVLASGFCGFSLMNTMAEEPAAPVRPDCYMSIEIRRGDTLWDIAETYADACGLSVQEYVQELKDINGLNGDLIHEDHHLTIVYCDTVYK